MNQHTQQQNEYWKVLVLLLKSIAAEKGITQQDIADKTGLMQSNIARVFALRYCPRMDTFLTIARAIGINFFFEDKDGTTDLTILFERAMTQLGRRPDDSKVN